MNETCANCGTEVPTESKFCLQCGAEMHPEEPMTMEEPVHPLLKSLFTKNLIIAGLLLGLLLAWIGSTIMTFSTDTTGVKASMTINYLGFFLISIFLIGGGLVNDLLDRYLRLGMVFGGAYLLASSLVVSMSSILAALKP